MLLSQIEGANRSCLGASSSSIEHRRRATLFAFERRETNRTTERPAATIVVRARSRAKVDKGSPSRTVRLRRVGRWKESRVGREVEEENEVEEDTIDTSRKSTCRGTERRRKEDERARDERAKRERQIDGTSGRLESESKRKKDGRGCYLHFAEVAD